ncbi:PHD and RING finger domain-containing protein 1 [Orchesella cincta]|uniref:PHD and RING finger domain-containing protein 1 n=1 Tax=Orchesella cincta TaxID=48709 RepID=A0A1D2NHI5_ORCCI|nr:PHD and RING finger domain-containing protein 1 [Orchesella cincta]
MLKIFGPELSTRSCRASRREFLQAWQTCDGACARRQDDDDGNDKVEGVKGCLLDSKKSSTRNVFADSLPYSPSCEFEAEARENEDDVLTKSVEIRNCDDVVSSDCKSKANSRGNKVARSNNAARTPSCSGSDFDFGEDSPDSIPSSAAALIRNNGRMGKLNRIERVSSEVKIALYPFFKNKAIDKNEYKYILKGAVTKIYRAKSKPIVHSIIKSFVESYVHKIQIRRNAGRGRF